MLVKIGSSNKSMQVDAPVCVRRKGQRQNKKNDNPRQGWRQGSEGMETLGLVEVSALFL